MNLMMLLEMQADAFGDRVAVGDSTTGLRFRDLFEQAGQLAALLRSGDAERLAFVDIASPSLPVALYGSSWAGKAFVPISYRLAPDRLADLVARQAPSMVFAGADYLDTVSATSGNDAQQTGTLIASLAGTQSADRAWSSEPEDIGVLLHTSGTSGDPKVAVLRQKHLVSYVLGSVEFMGAEEDECALISVPPYHIAGIAALITNGYAGRRIVQLPNFEPAEWVRLVREHSVTHAMVVPTMLNRILDILGDGKGLPSLRNLSYGGGRMPLPVIERAMTLLPGVSFVNAYGLTETSSSIAVLGPDDHRDAWASDDPAIRARLGSVGQPLPTVEITIRDEEGTEVAAGISGEVWVRGEQVSGEYGGKSLLNAEGWFATNDGGRFDEAGYLFVEGRIDDVIVRGGENLSPGEIEDVLLSHPGVSECCVLGVPDLEWGETVAAVVVVAPGASPTVDELRQWVTTSLRSSRAPALIEFRSELPINDTGKVLRRVLKVELSAQITNA